MCAQLEEVFGVHNLSFSWNEIQPALIIFILRIITFAVYPLRINMVASGKKTYAWLLALFQASVFIFTFIAIITELDNWWKIFSYTTGFATGNVIGMIIEEKIAVGYTLLRIISPGRGAEITERLRYEGYAVTEVSAYGKDGAVALLHCNVKRKETSQLEKIIMNTDNEAFITALPVRPLQRGFWRNKPRSLVNQD